MRTTIDLDDDLVEAAAALTGIRRKRDLVHEALRTLVRARMAEQIEGTVSFADGYDHRAARKRTRQAPR